MTHRLAEPGQPGALGRAPMTAALRFRCACGNRELLTIQTVFPSEATELEFIHTMRRLWQDMQFEIQQHLRDQP